MALLAAWRGASWWAYAFVSLGPGQLASEASSAELCECGNVFHVSALSLSKVAAWVDLPGVEEGWSITGTRGNTSVEQVSTFWHACC